MKRTGKLTVVLCLALIVSLINLETASAQIGVPETTYFHGTLTDEDGTGREFVPTLPIPPWARFSLTAPNDPDIPRLCATGIPRHLVSWFSGPA